MKNKIIIAILSLLLAVSLLGNYILYGVLNDEINAERAIIRCLAELDGTPVEDLTIQGIAEHNKNCVFDNTTLR